MEDVQGDFLVIREDAHHILHVLRKEQGDRITVCDGQGQDYACEIFSAAAGEIKCRILKRYPCQAEPAVAITIFQGLPKAEKMEWILQKGVEIGVCGFVPVMTERSVVKLEQKKAEGKRMRWSKIAESAAKQSGRGVLPQVYPVASLKESIKTFDNYDLVLVLYEETKDQSLKKILRGMKERPQKIAVWIGPEGGWAPEEIETLQKAGAVTAGLGPRILRTETAGMAAAALILYEYDQM